MLKFTDFNLIDPIQKAIKEAGYETPTPIQERAIPLVLAGHDLLGIAQTGTGKTAAFCLPILNILHLRRVRQEPRCPRVLVLTPTRELAIQIHENLVCYGHFLPQKYAVIFGGVGQGRQVQSLRNGTDVLVATPGRLLDLIQQRHLRLDKTEIFVLDEADRMLDMGFMRDIKKILPLLPRQRHNLFFSATMPNEIQVLASKILVNPKKIEVTPPATTVKRTRQMVMFVDKKDKLNLLVHLLKNKNYHKSLVFVEMKHVANRVAEKLETNGIAATAIHGNKSQGARQRALQDFTQGRVKVMVATDIASRGIDIDGITHVINFELSNVAENYVHRIGRTARAGADGIAISLVTGEEKSYLANIERIIKQELEVIRDQPYHSESATRAKVIGVGKAKALIEGRRPFKKRHLSGR
ncbi:MAG: DEAD/DEAH box helicase [Bdellovibrionales bacterium RBG_16_40_8]|nr:MAG: DEAD/DEAH box helicase [Bdellovibrionales bacterium RBG_16_40_8]